MKSKKIDRTLVITSLLCLVPIIMYLIVWDKLPDPMPIHFDSAGVANNYAPKALATFGITGLMLVLNIILNIAVEHDPKKENSGKKIKEICKYIICVVSIVTNVSIILYCLNMPVNIAVVVYGLIGVTFIIIGNYMPKCQQNYTIGIKVPWTLNNEVNWQKTHRLAGYLFMLSGVIMLINIFLDISWIMLPVIILCAIVPIVYSFVLYKKGY